MKPDLRKIDLIVAEKVMGNPPPTTKPGEWPTEYNSWCDQTPLYSSSIADAFDVVSKLNLPFKLERDIRDGRWTAEFEVNGHAVIVAHDLPSAAICYAALNVWRDREGAKLPDSNFEVFSEEDVAWMQDRAIVSTGSLV